MLPLSKTAREVLTDWIKRNPEGPLFPNRLKEPIRARGVRKLIEEYAYRAKIEASHTA